MLVALLSLIDCGVRRCARRAQLYYSRQAGSREWCRRSEPRRLLPPIRWTTDSLPVACRLRNCHSDLPACRSTTALAFVHARITPALWIIGIIACRARACNNNTQCGELSRPEVSSVQATLCCSLVCF